MEVSGKVIVITGGGQGLGLSMALAMADKGAKLALIDLNEQALLEAVKACEQRGSEARAYRCNVAKESEVISTFDQILEDFGALHALINNAGILRDGLLIKTDEQGAFQCSMSLDEWQAVIDVNLTGVFLCGREAAERMLRCKSAGVIINISSISRAGNVGQSNYSAAKAGVAAMSVSWAKELARYSIRVAAVAPGFIATDMVASIKPEMLEKMAAHIPLKRLGTAEEVAHSCLYILENDYFTGRVLELDGGLRV